MGMIDIVLIVLVIIALIIGIYKGIAGVLLGFFGTIVIAVALAIGIFFLSPSMMYGNGYDKAVNDESVNYGYSSAFYGLYAPIDNSLRESDNEILHYTVINDPTSDKLVVFVKSEEGENGEIKKFSEVAGGILASLTDKVSLDFLDSFIDTYGCEGLTVADAISAFCAKLSFCAIVWLVSFIVLVIIKAIIRRLVFKFLDNHSALSKIDRAIGGIVAVAIVIAIAWVSVCLVGVNAENWGVAESFNETLAQNPIINFFNKNNVFSGTISNGNLPDDAENSIEKVCRITDAIVR